MKVGLREIMANGSEALPSHVDPEMKEIADEIQNYVKLLSKAAERLTQRLEQTEKRD